MERVAQLPFPFYAALPQREKSRVATLWDELTKLSAVAREHGAYLPSSVAGDLLGVSSQRVSELMSNGRFETVTIGSRRFVLEKSIREFAASDRKNGRPFDGLEPGQCKVERSRKSSK